MVISKVEMERKSWTTRVEAKKKTIESVQGLVDGVIIPTKRIVEVLERLIKPGDRVVLEGNNQKQASFLSKSLVQVDPKKFTICT